VEDGKTISNFGGQPRLMAFSPSGDYLAIDYYTELIVVNFDLSQCDSNAANCATARGQINPRGPASQFSYSIDGRTLWVRTKSSLTLWRPLDGAQLYSNDDIPYLEGDQLSLSPDGNLFYLRRSLWRVSDFTLLHQLTNELVTYTCVAFSNDSRLLATANGENVTLFDTSSGQKLVELKVEGNTDILQIAFSQDGTWLSAATENGTIQRWGIP
jgi:WD40 repeat protein